MGKYKCLCCGFYTLDERGEYDICPVCFWEDERYLYVENNTLCVLKDGEEYVSKEYSGEDVLDLASGANHGLTLRQARENYKNFGACEKSMLPHVRKPYQSEME